MTREWVFSSVERRALRKRYPAGCRVKLERMENEPHAPPVGMLGTVMNVDDMGTIHVNWDNGSGLGVVYGVDRCRRVREDDNQTESK